ncbi:MAG: M20/M25/M40 family metallo-hydrolase [Caulobacteraceae bacterium]|jgi:hypothetical protein
MMRIAALLAVLAAAFALFYASARTPAPAPANAALGDFSAGRAMRDIAVIGAVPHPVGSPANAAVRDYVVRRMTELGLSPRVQSDEGVRGDTYWGERWIGGAKVDNVIGVLRGRDPTLPALALMAHHDTVPGSPGAADDTAGVASALEVARAIEAGGQPLRDVILIITDGEEAGLLGAQAFFADDPAARHVGFVINMETRGGGGRAQMFETGPGNGPAVKLFLASAKRPLANSLSVFIYKQLPNDTDYTVARAARVPGLNLAFIGRQFDYHSPSSTVAALDKGAVQSLGDQVLGPARALANASTLPPRSEDAVYGNLVGDAVLAYPAWAGWILVAVSAGLLAWGVVRGQRAKDLGWLDLAQGVGAGVLLLVALALGLHAVRHLTGVGFGWIEGRPLLARFPAFEAAMALAGLATAMLTFFALSLGEARLASTLAAAAAALAAQAFGGFDVVALWEGGVVVVLALILTGRPLGFTGAWLGGLAVAFLLTLVLQVIAPTTAFLVAWPLVAALAVLHLVALNARVPPQARWSAALVLMVLTAAWAGGVFHPLLQAMDLPEPAALPLWLAALALWPLLWPRPGSRAAHLGVALLALAAAVGVALTLAFTPPWTVRHPNVVEPLYVVDDGHAWRVSPFEPDAWTRAMLKADGGKIGLLNFPAFRGPVWAAPAAPVTSAAPTVDLARAADGTVEIKASADPSATLHLDVKTDAVVTGGAVDGRPTPMLTEPGRWTHFVWGPGTPLEIAFKPVGHGTLDIRYAAWTPSWPASAKPLPTLPPRLMAWDMADSTVTTGALRSAW